MDGAPRFALIGLGILAGVPIGGVAGFLLTWAACLILDPFINGLGMVGWVYCFFTIPCGALVGAVLGGLAANSLARRSRRLPAGKPPS